MKKPKYTPFQKKVLACFKCIEARLKTLTDEVDAAKRTATRRSRTERELELQQMITTEALAAELARIRGVVPSFKAFLKAQDEKYAALAASMSDEEDQAKVNAMAEEARLGADELAAALVANPAPTDPPAEPPVG